MIPKLIHQTTSNKVGINQILLDNIERTKSLNPHYEYKLYDNADREKFILDSYGRNMLDYYRRINPLYGAARADFFRYLLMYKVGGVYLDIKSSILINLDEIITDTDVCILSNWLNREADPFEGWGMHEGCGPRGEFQQWFLIAAPGHPYFQSVISRVINNITNYTPERSGVGVHGVVNTTGPVAFTKAIFEMQDAFNCHDYRLVDIELIGIRYQILGHDHKALIQQSTGAKHYSELTDPLVLPVGDQRKFSNHRAVFNRYYRDHKVDSYFLGIDSTMRHTVKYRSFIEKFIVKNEIKTIVDAGCGEWNFSRLIDWQGADYTGVDVSDIILKVVAKYASDKVKFLEANMLEDDLPEADLLIVKDVFDFWTNEEISHFLSRIGKYKHVLVVGNCIENETCQENIDLDDRQRRDVDLILPPFNVDGHYVYFYNGHVRKSVFAVKQG